MLGVEEGKSRKEGCDCLKNTGMGVQGKQRRDDGEWNKSSREKEVKKRRV